MRITSIEPQKRHSKRFNLYIDGEFFCGISEDTIVRKNLKIGQTFTKAELDNLLQEEQYSKAFDKALHLLAYRPRSEKEIKDKLEKKDFHSKIIKRVIKELKKEDLLNDEKFTQLWIANRNLLKPSGKYVLEKELRQKGVKEDIIRKIIAQELDKEQELKLALKAAEKKKQIYQALPRLERQQKMSQFLARRGFSWETIKKVLNQLEPF